LALAGGLVADGHRVRILEQAAGLREDGAAVTIFSNGTAAMAELGAPLEGFGRQIEELDFRTADGSRLCRIDLRVLHRRTGFPVVLTPRQKLIAHLAESLPAEVVSFSRGVASVAVRSDAVEVTDALGGVHTADVVVGADGYRSVVRGSVADAAPAAECGWSTWQGLTPHLPQVADGSVGRMFLGRTGSCGLMPAGDGLLQWWFDVRDPGPLNAPEGAAAWLRRHFTGFAQPVTALLDRISDADVGRYPHVLHQIPDRWGTGRTTLVGDAAHAFPPTQSQGANQALEDAWLLTRALRTPDDPAAALRRYERRRARRVRRVSRMAANPINYKPPAVLTALTRLMPPVTAGRAYLALLRGYSSVLHDERP
jgi:FAD-dependent urate hydroxylase